MQFLTLILNMIILVHKSLVLIKKLRFAGETLGFWPKTPDSQSSSNLGKKIDRTFVTDGVMN